MITASNDLCLHTGSLHPGPLRTPRINLPTSTMLNMPKADFCVENKKSSKAQNEPEPTHQPYTLKRQVKKETLVPGLGRVLAGTYIYTGSGNVLAHAAISFFRLLISSMVPEAAFALKSLSLFASFGRSAWIFLHSLMHVSM